MSNCLSPHILAFLFSWDYVVFKIRTIRNRIDENMDDTLANVEGAQGQLLKYLNSISSNRWLMMKIFFVLMVFLMIFIFFVAWFPLAMSPWMFCIVCLLCVVYSFDFYQTTTCTQFSPGMISSRLAFCGHVNWEKLQNWYVKVFTTCSMYHLMTHVGSNVEENCHCQRVNP